MSLLTPATATATVANNTAVVTITGGIDLNTVLAGMVVHFGSRTIVQGNGYIIASVAPSGTSGGTITLQANVTPDLTAVPFVIDTTGYAGNGAGYSLYLSQIVLNTISKMLGAGMLYADSRVIELDAQTSGALAQIVFKRQGAHRAMIEQRTQSGQPILDFRFSADGTNWNSSFSINLNTGALTWGAPGTIQLLGVTVAAKTLAASAKVLVTANFTQETANGMTWDGSTGLITIASAGRYILTLRTSFDCTAPTYGAAVMDVWRAGSWFGPLVNMRAGSGQVDAVFPFTANAGDYISLEIPSWLTSGFRMAEITPRHLRVAIDKLN